MGYRSMGALVFCILAFCVVGCNDSGPVAPPSPTTPASQITVPLDVPTIQAGIDSVGTGGIVRLEPGLFLGEGNVDLDFHGKDITLTCSKGAAEAVIDGRGKAQGIHLSSGETEASAIVGITFRNCYGETGGAIFLEKGASPRISSCVFERNAASAGGGIACAGGASPGIDSCRFVGNTDTSIQGATTFGGAAIWLADSRAIVRACSFQENSADGPGAAVACVRHTEVTLEDCKFEGNTTGYFGAGLYVNSSVVATRCTFSNNAAEPGLGGGVFCAEGGRLELRECEFLLNAASVGGGVNTYKGHVQATDCSFERCAGYYDGGAFFLEGGSAILRRCRFSRGSVAKDERGKAEATSVAATGGSVVFLEDCELQSEGGGTSYDQAALRASSSQVELNGCSIVGGIGTAVSAESGATVQITSCTIADNQTGGVSCRPGATATVNFSILANNRFGVWADRNSDDPFSDAPDAVIAISCCDVSGNQIDLGGLAESQIGTNGNLSVDPLFCAPGLDYHLQEASACGPDSSTCGLIGAMGVGCP